MRYPNWFPRPRAWLEAINLLVCTIPIGLVTRMMGEMMFNFFRVAWEFDNWRVWAWLATTIVPTVWVLAHEHQFLWGDPNPKFPKWFPSLRSWGEGFYSWLVFWLCFLTLFLIATIELYARGKLTAYNLQYYLDDRMNHFLIGFTILAAYCYHFKTLIAKRFQPQKRA